MTALCDSTARTFFKRHMTKILGFIIALCLSAPAAAVFKCVQNGKITYSDQACPDGQGKLMPLPPTTSADAMQQASQRAQEEKRAVEKFEKQEQHDALLAQKSRLQLAKTAAAHQRLCATLAQQHKWREEDARHAAPRSAAKARRNAQRAAEKYAAQCQPT